jgi:hypothetical protein
MQGGALIRSKRLRWCQFQQTHVWKYNRGNDAVKPRTITRPANIGVRPSDDASGWVFTSSLERSWMNLTLVPDPDHSHAGHEFCVLLQAT